MTLDITIVNVALPDIAADLDAGLNGLQWVANGYPLAFAALLLTAGSLSDRIGRRLIFGVGIAVFTIASAACGLAPGVTSLSVFRVVQGAGGALVMATAMALIADAYPPGRARQTAVGLFAAAGGASLGLGPVLGGFVVDGLGWRWIFWINVPLGIALVAGTVWRLRESGTSRGGRLDLPGVLLAVAVLFGLNYGLLTGPSQGWTDPAVLTALIGSAVLAAVFVAVEARSSDAMLDLELFRIPTFTGAILLTFLARVTTFGILPYLILWLQGMLGHSPSGTGIRLLAMTLPILMVAPLAGRLQHRVPASRLMAAGFALIAVGFATMLVIGPDSGWTAAFPGLVLLGVGGALAFPPLIGVAIDVVPAHRAGMASGLSNTFFPLGTATGVAVYGAVFTARINADLPAGIGAEVATGRFTGPDLDAARTAFTGALTWICGAASVAAAVAVVVALTLIRERDLPAPERAEGERLRLENEASPSR
jgi:EmrB/QacA subfamily drug resistance transporter